MIMTAKSPKLVRRVNCRKTTVNISCIPKKRLTSDELESLPCHFNWDICEEVTESTLQERILSVECHIKENAKTILPQSYCLLAYLKRKSSDPLCNDIQEEVHRLLSLADKFLPQVDEKSNKIGLGYRAVVLANFIYIETDTGNHKMAMFRFNKYEKILEKYAADVESHPEVLAMKAFALGYSFGSEKSRRSEMYYRQALSDEDYKDNVHWLFGLAHSKTLIANENYPRVAEHLLEIEKIYRRVIELDPTHNLGMIRLASILNQINGILCFDEIEFWIEKALKIDRKLIILEQAAMIYQRTIKDRKSHMEKAFELFEEAEKIDESSRNTICGLADLHFRKYLNNKERNKKSKKLPEDLKKAHDYFVKSDKDKRHSDRLKIANVYGEMAKFKGYGDYREKAEEIYKDVIEDTTKEKDLLRTVEAHWKYSVLLRNNKEKEIEQLKKAIEVPIGSDDGLAYDMPFVRKCQDQLLFYADDTDLMTEEDGLILKSIIQMKRGNLQSAIFYTGQAKNKLKMSDDNRTILTLNSNIADCYLELSKSEQPLPNLSKIYFDKALCCIDDEMENSNEKYDLKFKARQMEINKLMGDREEFGNLKKSAIEYEKELAEIRKQMLKTVRFSTHQEESTEEMNIIMDVLSVSKRLLDSAMNTIKVEIYGLPNDKPPYCYYPSPKSLQSTKMNSISEQMQQLLKRYKFKDFETDFPGLFNFLVEKQDGFVWLQPFIDIRNEHEHFKYSHEKCIAIFPSLDDRTRLVKDICQYVVEVHNRINTDVEQYLKSRLYSV